MNIDFSNEIIKMKEGKVLHKPFPVLEGFALFSKDEKGEIIKIVFSSEEDLKAHLNKLGYDWGNEKKGEYRNFDSEKRLFSIFPELKNVKTTILNNANDLNSNPVIKKNYLDFYKNVTAEHSFHGSDAFHVGDHVKNINEHCKHYMSEGIVNDIKELWKDEGVTVGYECLNEGNHWEKGDVLYKTPNQLKKIKK